MAVLQTTYPSDIAKGFPGMIANGEEGNRISRTIEAPAGIAFGVGAFRGLGDHGVVAIPTAAMLLGITIANYASPPAQSSGIQADIYTQFSTVGILTAGCIWVTVGADVTDGAQAYATTATGVITSVVGTNIILPGWFFEDTITSGGIARIARR